MPLDILFEIFKLVDPVDLLHLSHANKTLRSTLLRKSCKWIWEYSVKHYRTPIPPCMDDRLPLPQYINLLFTQNCFECGSSKGKHALWCFFDRVCSDCIHEKYMALDSSFTVSHSGVHTRYRMPGSNSRKLKRVVSRQEYDEVRQELWSIEDGKERCERELEIHNEACRIMKFDGIIEAFFQLERRKNNRDLSRIRIQRYNFLIEKLKEMGYEDELPKLRAWKGGYLDKYIDRDTELTARGWVLMAQNVKEYMDELIRLRKKAVAVESGSAGAQAEPLRARDSGAACDAVHAGLAVWIDGRHIFIPG
ncbi:uncharacterized protein SCHCODRAFT_02672718 [Schizophyllum commune H4-8]|uniref:uncharacterized protein n=1 Tax=Schizophyllum commune (strain H4-8 / FGSC 9210) TaxID=578458 RepID=UPI00215F6AEB|nr:uncharacterized protein SCHCODRAFT_02672718 [Schizophyllum commune H4-8]KAI5886551.1 hypothetical protein SCHCODRAFT_02672718 [Schizophyllum commune H4-8]